jgi:threonine dehydrogenase-like Zn-dependent dehydrogenase
MKAAQLVAPRRFRFIDIPVPDLSDAPPESVLVKVERAAICGSDTPSFAYDHPASSYPMPPGVSIHECVGVVAASSSPRFREGDPVLALPNRSDGLSEYFMAAASRTIHLTPFPHKEQILMLQPLGTVVWACRKLPNLLLKDAVVVGQGPMGLLMAHTLSNLGAKTVIAMDRLDYRLEVARKMRATHAVNVDREDPVEAVRRITDGRMADLVVEIVGHQQETLNTCLELVKRGGTVLAFGVPDDQIYGVDFSRIIRQNITLMGTIGPDVQNDFPMAMDMIVQGRVNVAPMITHILPFEAVQRGFEMFVNRTDGAIKVVLDYDVA